MNIKTAKQEISNSIKAYVAKDEKGEYLIPTNRQRPILLIGPPGVGKTAIMEQVAAENKVALVSYTITHHTRSSAMGLAQIVDMYYNKEPYTVTKYTMSEIIASIYRKMNITGLSEGILFLDEINCVDESLSPAILQFLQCKTFGPHKVPDGWVIVVAGNPKEYNDSVREFDIATLDRLKKMDIQPDFDVWCEYAWGSRVHSAIIAYLYTHQDKFYYVNLGPNVKSFVTARGWEDLSDMLKAYQRMGMAVEVDFVEEYLQNTEIANEFTQFYSEFNKTMTEYGFMDLDNIEDVDGLVDKYRGLSDEMKYAVVTLLVNAVSDLVCECEYEMYFAKNVLSMSSEIMDNYERTRSDYRYDTYSISERVRQKLVGLEEANLLSKIELSALKNAVKFVDDVALKYARGRDEFLYADEMTSQVNSEFEPILKNYYDFLRNTKVAISRIFSFAGMALEGEHKAVFDKEISRNPNWVRFESEPHFIDEDDETENILLEKKYDM